MCHKSHPVVHIAGGLGDRTKLVGLLPNRILNLQQSCEFHNFLELLYRCLG